MRFGILGPLEVTDARGRNVALGGRKQRSVLVILLLHANQVVSRERLIDELWGERPPATAAKTLQVYVSNLRKALGGGVLVTAPSGYVVHCAPAEFDCERFAELAADARRALRAGAARDAAELSRTALALWRGPPLTDFAYEPFAQGEIARIEELRLTTIEDRIEADLALGDHSALVGELQALAADNPLRERMHAQLMLALYRAGRQAEALDAYGRARRHLADELGIEPGPELRALQAAVLGQDPSLAIPRRGAVPATRGNGLLERDGELEQVDRLLSAARDGVGSVAVVEGPAGIGKSKLLAAIRARADAGGYVVASARGSEFETEMAFGVARQLLEPLVRNAGAPRRGQLLQGAARAGALTLGLEDAEPLTDRFDAIHGLYWICANAAREQPLAILVDDAHWADDGSVAWLGYLARRVRDMSLMLWIVLRSGDAGGERAEFLRLVSDPGIERLELAPLTPAGVGAMVRSQLDAGADDPFCAACSELSNGNPLFVRELLTAARAEELPARSEGVPALRSVAPAAVATSVLARLGRLGDHAVALARAVAVLDTGAEVALAAELAGIDSADAELTADRLAAAQIFAAARPLEFGHPLIAAAVRDDTAPGARRVAHRRAAELLYRGAHASLARVAAHLMLCGPGDDAWVVDVLRGAAGEAAATGAPESAISYLERALNETATPEVRVEVLFELGRMQLLAGQPGATKRLREAFALSANRRRRAEISLVLGRALLGTSDAAARDAFRRGLAELSEDEEDELSLELQGWNMTSSYARDESALSPAARVRLRTLLAGDSPARTRPERFLLAHVAFRSALSGDRPHDRVIRLAVRALADGTLLEDSKGDVGTHGAACYALLFAGEPDTAITELSRAMAWSRHRGARVMAARFSLLLGVAHYERGELVDALEHLTGAAEAVEERLTRDIPAVRAFAALCLIERDDLTAAAEALAAAPSQEPSLAQGNRVPHLCALARLRSAQGAFREALHILLECDGLTRQLHARNPAAGLSWRSEAAVLAARVGDRDLADALIAEELALARTFGAPHALGVALRAAGMVAGVREGLEQLSRSVEMLERSATQLELARSLTEHGAALRRAGRTSEARAQLGRGLDLAHRLGARRIANHARAELVAAGAKPRRDAIFGREALTAGELRVAQLAAQGLTNRELAQALFISPATAKTHLNRAYRKLAITRRDQLVEALGPAVSDKPADPTTAAERIS